MHYEHKKWNAHKKLIHISTVYRMTKVREVGHDINDIK